MANCYTCGKKLTQKNSTPSGRKTKICRECKSIKDKEYRAKNRERCIEISRKYYQENKEEISKKSKIYRDDPENKKRKSIVDKEYREGPAAERIKARKKRWYEENIEHCAKKQKINRLKNHEHYKEKAKEYRNNPEKKQIIKDGKARCYQNNKAHYYTLGAKRRAIKKDAILPTTDSKKIRSIFKEMIKKNKKAGETKYHVDHIIPLSIGGAHHQDNLRIITKEENIKKFNHYFPELGGVWANNKLAKETKRKLKI